MLLYDLLNEDLGTLQKLNVGPLIDILKQSTYTSNRHRNHEAGNIGKKFYNSFYITNTSEITDPFPITQGIKSLRKAYLNNEQNEPKAFAIYLNNTAVGFGLFDYSDLRSTSKFGIFAFDLTPFAAIVNQIDDDEFNKNKPSWGNQVREPSKIQSYHEKQPHVYSSDREKPGFVEPKPLKYQGKLFSPKDIDRFLNKLELIANAIDGKITTRLVLRDKENIKKRNQRMVNTPNSIRDFRDDLTRRLSIYKNSKKPTVDTIEQFIKYSLNHPGKTVQFDGYTYKLSADTMTDKIPAQSLLLGKSFTVYYSCVDPGSYNSMKITYRFDRSSNQLLPIYAVWDIKSKDNTKISSYKAILDPSGYIKSMLGTEIISKDNIIKGILGKMKNGDFSEADKLIVAAKKMGESWPELDVIQKSIDAEKLKASTRA